MNVAVTLPAANAFTAGTSAIARTAAAPAIIARRTERLMNPPLTVRKVSKQFWQNRPTRLRVGSRCKSLDQLAADVRTSAVTTAVYAAMVYTLAARAAMTRSRTAVVP
ncbi:hypothetical protein GCM10009681_52750 [Luedemannella helvata]|uniref:Uncharacterized protein n=1 Tax=Luedemannella helvata TaxID=349315 RepID=A0ABN2L570_9ACTN